MSDTSNSARALKDTPKAENTLSILQIAKLVGGEVIGSTEQVISGLSTLQDAKPSDVTFFAPTSPRMHSELLEAAVTTKAGAIFVRTAIEGVSVSQIVVKHPLAAAAQIAQVLLPKPVPADGIDSTAKIHSSATLGLNLKIGAYVVAGENTEIGDNTVIHPHVVIYPRAVIGANCVIHSGAVIREDVRIGNDCQIQNGVVIGGDGFGYFPDPAIGHRRIPHVGTVVLADGVDIGANSTIDRGTFGETRIGSGTKIDNLVMIAHNVLVGARTLLCGQVGISGSARVGDDVILAGQVGVADHSDIGNSTKVAAKSGITGKVQPNQILAGFPALEHTAWRRAIGAVSKLPDILTRLRAVERKLNGETNSGEEK